MTRSIRISERTAKALLNSFPLDPPRGALGRAFEELQKALEPKRHVLAAKKVKAKKTRAKSKSTKEIRAAVMKRADGLCELCETSSPQDLHHAFGRVRVRQAVSNCIGVCRPCHSAITDNSSDPGWLTVQIGHFERHGYREEARRMSARLESLQLQAEAQAVGGGK